MMAPVAVSTTPVETRASPTTTGTSFAAWVWVTNPPWNNFTQQYYGGLYRFILQITRRVDYVEEVINDVMFVVGKGARRRAAQQGVHMDSGHSAQQALQALRRNRSTAGASHEGDHIDLRPDKSVAFGELETKECCLR